MSEPCFNKARAPQSSGDDLEDETPPRRRRLEDNQVVIMTDKEDDPDDGDEEEDEAEANHDDDGSMAYIDQCFAGVSMTVQSLVKAFRSWVSAAAVNFGPESRA